MRAAGIQTKLGGENAGSQRLATAPQQQSGPGGGTSSTHRGLMHNKFAVIDGRLLINGSFNWTRQACLYNQENVIVTDNPQLVRLFAAQFEALWRRY
jgi:phosphatidylserine/phosphatidylglycerophosphate/cardiolipin synthase-like enzyme